MGMGNDPGPIHINIDVFGRRDDMHIVVQRSSAKVGRVIDSDYAEDGCSVLFGKHVLLSAGLVLPLEFSNQAPVEPFEGECSKFAEFADS